MSECKNHVKDVSIHGTISRSIFANKTLQAKSSNRCCLGSIISAHATWISSFIREELEAVNLWAMCDKDGGDAFVWRNIKSCHPCLLPGNDRLDGTIQVFKLDSEKKLWIFKMKLFSTFILWRERWHIPCYPEMPVNCNSWNTTMSQ